MRSQNILRPRSRFHAWHPVSETEMEGFLAIILNMGLIEMPEIENYWSTSWLSEVPFFAKVLSRDRFLLIFWLLHVSHEQNNHEPRRIDKVKSLLDLLVPKFQECYKPSQNLAVDETMVGFRGRFGAKQYMPNKPVKYGIKAFTMADSKEGYLLNILVYTGADTLLNARREYSSLPQPARIVLHLVDPYLDKGHHIFTDRYYTSIPLAQTLHQRTSFFTGTSMRNRVGLPSTIRSPPSKLRDDEVRAFRANHLLALEWRAAKKKSSLVMLSSSDSANTTQVVARVTHLLKHKPVVVDHYNQSMNGVDRADQCTVYYSFIRKCRKWWRKLFFWLLETTVVNSYIIYKTTVSHPLSHLEYRRRVIEALATRHITNAPPRTRQGRPRKRPIEVTKGDPNRLNGRLHIIAKLQNPHECVVCSRPAQKQRHRSLYYCKTCPSNPTLCVSPCFETYHTCENM